MSGTKYLTLMCLVWPDKEPFQHIVTVEIDSDKTIGYLKNMIKLEYSPKLDKVTASELVLWKCSIPVDDNLQKILESIRFDNPDTQIDLLFPISDILECFPTSLPRKTIHILVQVPNYYNQSDTHLDLVGDDHRPSKRARMGEKPSGWKLASNALHELWSLREQSDTKSFIERHLFKNTQASSSSSDSESLTQTYWVMRHQDGISELLDYSGLSGILIREEYTKALNAVIRFAETGKAADDDENKESDQSEAGVDDDHYYNLFLNLSDCQKSNGGFIVIGHPGIGKTVWLIVILMLRLQLGLPTIYQSKLDRMYFFNDDGAFEFPCGPGGDPDWRQIYDSFKVPSTTWALIDSNQTLVQVPMTYHDHIFVVQATSPHRDRFAWQDKSNRLVLFYIMNPWTLHELHLGRTLQEVDCSEEELTEFFNLYGPSARTAYANASALRAYQAKLRLMVTEVNYNDLDMILRRASSANLLEGVSHQIVLISSGESRNEVEVSIPTQHIYQMLRDAIFDRKEAACLCELFVRDKVTACSAGYVG